MLPHFEVGVWTASAWVWFRGRLRARVTKREPPRLVGVLERWGLVELVFGRRGRGRGYSRVGGSRTGGFGLHTTPAGRNAKIHPGARGGRLKESLVAKSVGFSQT